MKTRENVATGSPGQMLVVLSLVWFSSCTDVAAALSGESSQPSFVYVDDTRSYQSTNRLLSSIGSHEDGNINSRLYALGYVQRQQQQQQPSQVSNRFASVNVVPLEGNNFGYQSLTSSHNGALGSPGRSGEDSNYETFNEEVSTESDAVQSSASTQTEENYDSDGDTEADNDGAETQKQLNYGDENGGNAGTSLGNADNEESGAEEDEQPSHPEAKSGYRRRRRRTKRVKPKVIIVKKIIPVSTTTYAYIGAAGR